MSGITRLVLINFPKWNEKSGKTQNPKTGVERIKSEYYGNRDTFIAFTKLNRLRMVSQRLPNSTMVFYIGLVISINLLN